jgi:hypothetical protein
MHVTATHVDVVYMVFGLGKDQTIIVVPTTGILVTESLIQSDTILDVHTLVVSCTSKNNYISSKNMDPQILSFHVRPFLLAAIWRTKRLVSITSGRTHTARLYVKLPAAHRWHYH